MKPTSLSDIKVKLRELVHYEGEKRVAREKHLYKELAKILNEKSKHKYGVKSGVAVSYLTRGLIMFHYAPPERHWFKYVNVDGNLFYVNRFKRLEKALAHKRLDNK